MDPHTATYKLYAPMFFLICKYDCSPDKESETIEEVKAHAAQLLN